jgi:hypothetical protein
MKRFFFIVMICLTGSSVYAQDYQTAVGIRGPFVSGFTVKHFIQEDKALEGILSFGQWGMNITGLYEIHARAFDVEGLNWYYGGGAHLGSTTDEHPYFDEKGDFLVMGLDGIVGLEYNIQEIPINFSIDYKPQLNFIGDTGLTVYGGALSIRYTF